MFKGNEQYKVCKVIKNITIYLFAPTETSKYYSTQKSVYSQQQCSYMWSTAGQGPKNPIEKTSWTIFNNIEKHIMHSTTTNNAFGIKQIM